MDFAWLADPIMDNLESNNKQEHNWINILAKPTKPNELTDFRWSPI